MVEFYKNQNLHQNTPPPFPFTKTASFVAAMVRIQSRLFSNLFVSRALGQGVLGSDGGPALLHERGRKCSRGESQKGVRGRGVVAG